MKAKPASIEITLNDLSDDIRREFDYLMYNRIYEVAEEIAALSSDGEQAIRNVLGCDVVDMFLHLHKAFEVFSYLVDQSEKEEVPF